jgi:hypothetical protein
MSKNQKNKSSKKKILIISSYFLKDGINKLKNITTLTKKQYQRAEEPLFFYSFFFFQTEKYLKKLGEETPKKK